METKVAYTARTRDNSVPSTYLVCKGSDDTAAITVDMTLGWTWPCFLDAVSENV